MTPNRTLALCLVSLGFAHGCTTGQSRPAYQPAPYPGGYDYFLEKTGALNNERAALTST